MATLSFTPIGTIYTPHTTLQNMPIQPLGAKGIRGKIVLNKAFVEGLKDLEGFSHITILYHLHKAEDYSLLVTPFMDTEKRGLFATRAPKRPNPIGISTVQLIAVNNNELIIEDVDMLNETPLLDIKPFFSKFDNRDGSKSGWLDDLWNEQKKHTKSDGRFA
ncbi:tRNA (N6-threonylcarbamoyladenosine(37)-N6)-methyltransferase TrmO [Carboxylicivirga sp. A043]|uniref:tRNA (N6-threonylcarbamoyladenosine(37)-N6)-methyltransferase TrmO n=1 Tax=Carboxylicivirga litoralis TaxID=2816963 RepID=UPI0021CB11A5|nr:tRNA (N6-threonylcarbamoyladenosine(37)-N6)-methyltransferase TrmO [Carboxylicivirga sp. A043]MCU4154577.1 tRNA (N6-threonylcarbamoyladenosine(37)-N6)-methyltransferase TrmO [Carboxylicivirga sp. A043]